MEVDAAFCSLADQPICLIPHEKQLKILSERANLTIPLPQDLRMLAGGLHTLFSNSPVIGWHAKTLFSQVLGNTGQPLMLNPIDLCLLERFLGIRENPPEDYLQAKTRLAKILKHSSWDKLKIIHESIYKPLTTSVLPKMETLGLAHKGRKGHVHSCYEIEGQANGRLRCTGDFNPHVLTETEKEHLAPTNQSELFMVFDYKAMEVDVLAWLSGDKNLTGGYEGIWKKLTGQQATPKTRKLIKCVFLPIVYGMGAGLVCKKTGLSDRAAENLIGKIYAVFPHALEYIESQAKGLTATDYFGRCREFDEPLKIRNFVVQAPAALICLHKLVQLDAISKLAFSVHDAFGILIDKFNWKKTFANAVGVLEADDPLYPNLHLTAACMAGANLNHLKPIRRSSEKHLSAVSD